MVDKERLDRLLLAKGLCESRTEAQALCLAGEVYWDEQRVDKPGTRLPIDASLTVRARRRFVSRGGEKLQGALTDFALDPRDCVCVDIGASTGGFTDCLLQAGAARVYAVDVGRGQLDPKLRQDPRVVDCEKTNARSLERDRFPEPIDWVVIDASFIGLEHLAPTCARLLSSGGVLVALAKPQFEVGRDQARRNRGVIRDEALRQSGVDRAARAIEAAGFRLLGRADSRLRGPKGNLECFLYARRL